MSLATEKVGGLPRLFTLLTVQIWAILVSCLRSDYTVRHQDCPGTYIALKIKTWTEHDPDAKFLTNTNLYQIFLLLSALFLNCIARFKPA